MWRNRVILMMVGTFAMALAGCAITGVAKNESFVRGHILQRSDHTVLIDVGATDNVAVGDEFVVYRVTPAGNPNHPPVYYAKWRTGSLRIVDILGNHQARATIESGAAKVGEMVEERIVR